MKIPYVVDELVNEKRPAPRTGLPEAWERFKASEVYHKDDRAMIFGAGFEAGFEAGQEYVHAGVVRDIRESVYAFRATVKRIIAEAVDEARAALAEGEK